MTSDSNLSAEAIDVTQPSTRSVSGALIHTGRTVTTFGGDLLEFIGLDPDAVSPEAFAVLDYQLAQRLQVAPVEIDRVEVVRSSSANRSGDALAGTINIVLRDALALDGGYIRAGALLHVGEDEADERRHRDAEREP